MLFDFQNITDPLEREIAALNAAREYQAAWKELGVVGRVDRYFEDVEGDWLEEFEEIEDSSDPCCVP